MIGDLLKSIFGDKTAKDRKEYWPFVEKANAAWQTIQNLSDDQLRDKTRSFQAQVTQSIATLEEELAALQAQAADLNTPFEEKEKLYDQIDQMVKTIDDRIEEELLVILPEAFAVVKETARRWAENGQLSVSATDFDASLPQPAMALPSTATAPFGIPNGPPPVIKSNGPWFITMFR